MSTNKLLSFPANAGEFTAKKEFVGAETKIDATGAKAGHKAKPLDHSAAGDSNIYFNNSSSFWLHATVHLSDFTASRLRLPLGTKDKKEAIARRDLIFSVLRELEGFIASPSAKSKHSLTRHFRHAA